MTRLKATPATPVRCGGSSGTSELARFVLLISIALPFSPIAYGQYLGLGLRGDLGVQSGSQPPPGIYIVAPLFYRNDYTGLRDRNGDTVLGGVNIRVDYLAIPAIAVTTTAKLLGGTYGFQLAPMYANTRLNLASRDAQPSTGYGSIDMWVQPFSLGWNTKRADYVAAYALYAPTGKITLDMWAHEVSGGTTLYFGEKKHWNLAANGTYEIHQKKRSADIRVGDILTVEGGAARSFLEDSGYVGAAYVMQWKVTKDSGSDIPASVIPSHGQVYGVGPDVQMPVFYRNNVLGLVGVRYIWEFGARANFEGRTLMATFTIAKFFGGKPNH